MIGTKSNYAEEPTLDSTRRESLFSREMNLLTENVMRLEDIVQELSRRLNPVLRSELDKGENVGKPEELLPEVPELVKNSRYRVAGIARTVEGMIERLEI